MENSSNFDLFYDVLDESLTALYEIKKDNFFNLLVLTGKNILSQEILIECSEETEKKLKKIYRKLDGVNFNVEEIRKAFQMMLLRAIKSENFNYSDITPDTIGMFMAYLIQKLKPNQKELTILDPVCGSGNLLYSTANHLECDLHLLGIDALREILELATILGDLLNYDIEMFCQDTLSHPLSDVDIVVADLPAYFDDSYNNQYFPYLCVLEHLASLKEDGYFIALAPNDFFEHDDNSFFKDNLKNLGSILSVLELPKNMFQTNAKSIIIFSREPVDKNSCMVMELPSFSDGNALNQALLKLENWFEKRKK